MIDLSNLFKLRQQLHDAITSKNIQILKQLLGNVNFINLNYVDKEGQTPLHRSCRLGNLKIVELLCEYGASQMIINRDGWFPIHLAAYYGHIHIVSYLLKQQQTKQSENNNDELLVFNFSKLKI